jgi:hypothetical protein
MKTLADLRVQGGEFLVHLKECLGCVKVKVNLSLSITS